MRKRIVRAKKIKKRTKSKTSRKKPARPTEPEFRGLFSEVINRRQRAFLVGYVRSLGIRSAARLSGVSRQSHYEWMRGDPLYREHFHRARTILADAAEEEVCRRAYHGYDTPVVYRGEIKGYYKSYSDSLAMFMLKGLRPEVYRDSAGAAFEGPTRINITVLHKENNADGTVKEPERISFPLSTGANKPAGRAAPYIDSPGDE